MVIDQIYNLWPIDSYSSKLRLLVNISRLKLVQTIALHYSYRIHFSQGVLQCVISKLQPR